jgi:cytochrome c biogenesis protein CcmG, thiol:disulfide interchange protein DsbE
VGPITPDNIDSALRTEIDKAVNAASISRKF